MMADLESLKKKAALQALGHIESDMLVGLGTGSTARYFIDGLGEKIRSGELTGITAVATSKASDQQARGYGIEMVELVGQTLDIAIDGMDEVDPQLNAIKGLGGALTREKIVESCAAQFILIGDETKTVEHLGQKARVPVEVVQFGYKSTHKKLEQLGLDPALRLSDTAPFVTDNHNYIFDCAFSQKDVLSLARDIATTPGVVEHGFFLGMAARAYIASSTDVSVMQRGDA